MISRLEMFLFTERLRILTDEEITQLMIELEIEGKGSIVKETEGSIVFEFYKKDDS